MKKRKNPVLVFGLLVLLVFAIVYFGIEYTANWGKSEPEITAENASVKLDRLYDRIKPSTAVPVKGQIDLDPVDLGSSLPDISKFPVTVEPTTALYVEIFSSTEKSGTGVDGWLTEAATEFNRAGLQVNGQPVSVQVRNIASGTAADFIKSGKYIPEGFTPSNELWGDMIRASGVQTELVSKRLIGNVPGIVIAKAKYDEFIEKYGAVNIKTVTDAIASNELAMGYTDPFASSTGLNFLLTALATFGGDDLLGTEAVQGFEQFQANVPFIASTTLQMREAAKSGALDAFVLEYQTFVNAEDLENGYVFTPFGVRHDSPLYALGALSADKREILQQFAEFLAQPDYQALGSEKGFNQLEAYQYEQSPVSGDLITPAQRLWKEKKNAARPIAAVFVVDRSGSMNGEPMNRLKESLWVGQKYLGRDNSIGLVSYAGDVTIDLPIAPYDTNQQSMFVGAVDALVPGGGTATFDAIAVAIKMLDTYKAEQPDVRPVIFVLSDGETNEGHSLNDIRDLIEVYGMPVYTIGYTADIQALQSISSINEAASINADTDDVVYKIGNLLNVQM